MIRHLLLASVMLSANLAFAAQPFRVVPVTNDLKQDSILFKQGGFAVLKNTDSVKELSNLYWVNVEGAKQKVDLKAFAEVLHEQKGLFSIVRPNNEDAIGQISGILHKIGQPCGALIHLTGTSLADETKIADPQPLVPVNLKQPRVVSMIANVNKDKIKASIEEISAIHTRYHSSSTGKTVADILAGMYRSYAQNRDDVEITTFDHGSVTPQPSLVVRIKGTESPTELVILGSHLDSINFWGPSSERSPGSDDNASGTATNLEVFRVLMEEGFRPARTVEIHAYAAEEIGLKGSQDIATKYKAANKNVISMVQHDMNLFSSDGKTKIWLVSNNTNASLNTSLSQLIDGYLGLPWESKSLSGGNSDHYSWTRAGYAASFPFENPSDYNESIHTEDDDVSHSGLFDQAVAFGKLDVAYIAHFAGKSL